MKYINLALKLTLALLTFQSLFSENLDLENGIQDFVLETKRIEIPGHPNAFNPSIIRWQGHLLMSFREIPSYFSVYLPCFPRSFFNHLSSETSLIGIMQLDDDFNPIGKAQMLYLDAYHHLKSACTRSEDARLFSIQERLYITYSDNKEEAFSDGGFRVYVAELHFDGNQFSVGHSECLSQFEGESKHRREKNWVPFEYASNLFMAYSLTPHRILQPLLGTGQCETAFLSQGAVEWEWGDLRGGTPAQLIDSYQYLAFFHSSKMMSTIHSAEKNSLHYFMGAYTFSSSPPFNITRTSPEPIVGPGFYNGNAYEPYWKPVQVIFPCGYIFDDQSIWVAYGRQDHEIWIVKLNKTGLLHSLVYVLD